MSPTRGQGDLVLRVHTMNKLVPDGHSRKGAAELAACKAFKPGIPGLSF
jgi:hypothetical protein